ncbi:hypothetical protein GCM10023324_13670 [Streptomyces youssoufiensis]
MTGVPDEDHAPSAGHTAHGLAGREAGLTAGRYPGWSWGGRGPLPPVAPGMRRARRATAPLPRPGWGGDAGPGRGRLAALWALWARPAEVGP